MIGMIAIIGVRDRDDLDRIRSSYSPTSDVQTTRHPGWAVGGRRQDRTVKDGGRSRDPVGHPSLSMDSLLQRQRRPWRWANAPANTSHPNFRTVGDEGSLRESSKFTRRHCLNKAL